MKARYIIIPVVVLVALALTTWALVKTFSQQVQYDLFAIRRGAVTKTVSVAGSVVSDQKFELGFLSPGIVAEVKVQVGDQVKAGDLLVTLDTSVLREQANQARASVSAASALLSKTRNHLRPADVNVLNQSLASARIALETAQKNLQDAYRSRDVDANNSSVAVNSAENAYQNALNAYNARLAAIDQGLVMAQVALANATNALNSTQNSYNQILNLYNLGQVGLAELQQAQAALSTANSAYISARAAYDSAIGQANLEKAMAAGSVDAARSQFDSARAAYNSASTGLDIKINMAQNSLRAAEASYNLAYAQYQQSLSPALGADISSASAQVAASAAAVRVIETQIAKASLTAPIDGVITAVNVTSHEISPMTAPAVVLETAGTFQIEAYVSEVDIERVLPGADVKITFDAIDQLEVHGTVAEIDPAATVLLGVVNYKVTIALPTAVAGLKSAMSADMDILTDQRDNVLFVPRNALTRTDGGYQVKILDGKTKVERTVQVGLLGDTEAEILSGINEGDQIILREL
ncbi:MAG: HlyD family efflux transporter periplasmic adaptor subunit [Patescibacteria group bacterium]